MGMFFHKYTFCLGLSGPELQPSWVIFMLGEFELQKQRMIIEGLYFIGYGAKIQSCSLVPSSKTQKTQKPLVHIPLARGILLIFPHEHLQQTFLIYMTWDVFCCKLIFSLWKYSDFGSKLCKQYCTLTLAYYRHPTGPCCKKSICVGSVRICAFGWINSLLICKCMEKRFIYASTFVPHRLDNWTFWMFRNV